MRSRELVVIGFAVFLFVIISLLSSFLGVYGSVFVMNENQILYLFSSSPQVLAGVYGLTLTGFIFFRNELDRDMARDTTLVEIVELLKIRYYRLLIFITSLVGVSIFVCNIVMAYEGSGDLILLSVLMNIGQSAFVVSLLIIGYFVFDVISPDRFKAASQELQHILDPSNKGDDSRPGNLTEFLREYNAIEALMQEYGNRYPVMLMVPAFGEERQTRRFVSNAKLADNLYRSGVIGREMLDRLKNLITLRNTIIHGADPVVSVDLVDEARDVRSKLLSVLES